MKDPMTVQGYVEQIIKINIFKIFIYTPTIDKNKKRCEAE